MQSTPLVLGLGEHERTLVEIALPWETAGLNQRGREAGAGRPRSVEFGLENDSVWRIAGLVRGLRVHCRAGRLWITQAGESADMILNAGQSFVAREDGAMVVQAVSAGTRGQNGAASTGDTNSGKKAVCVVTVAAETAPPPVSRGRCWAAKTRIGYDRIEPDRGPAGERVAFIVLWLCALTAIGYCLKMVIELA